MSRVYLGLVVLLVALSGCKSDVETAMSEMVDKCKEVTKILKSVTDKDSAVAAKAKLDAVTKDMTALATKYADRKATSAQMKAAQDKFKPDMDQTGKEIQAEIQRIQKIPGAIQPVSEAMLAMGTSLQKMANANR